MPKTVSRFCAYRECAAVDFRRADSTRRQSTSHVPIATLADVHQAMADSPAPRMNGLAAVSSAAPPLLTPGAANGRRWCGSRTATCRKGQQRYVTAAPTIATQGSLWSPALSMHPGCQGRLVRPCDLPQRQPMLPLAFGFCRLGRPASKTPPPLVYRPQNDSQRATCTLRGVVARAPRQNRQSSSGLKAGGWLISVTRDAQGFANRRPAPLTERRGNG